MWDYVRNVGERYEAEQKSEKINTHLKWLYTQGYEDGVHDGRELEEEKRDQITDKAYEDGMSKAWWAAKTVSNMSEEDCKRIFGTVFMVDIFRDRTPSTVISMLEKYEKDKKIAEEERKDIDRQFAIGNIVCNKQMKSYRLMVVRRYVDSNGVEKFCGVDDCGFYHDKAEYENFSWTGLHSGYMDFMKVPE